MSERIPDLPGEKSKKRTAMEVGSEGAIGAVPFVGSLLAATLPPCSPATQENRTREWMQEMAEVVQALLDRVEGLEAEELAENPAFYDAAVAAARIATATSAAEKHQALQNALFNVGIGDGLDADKRAIFLRYVDQLTPAHIALLRLADNPPGWFEARDLAWAGGGLLAVVKAAFPAWANDESFIDMLAADLSSRGLTDTLPLRVTMTDNEVGLSGPSSRATSSLSSSAGRSTLMNSERTIALAPLPGSERTRGYPVAETTDRVRRLLAVDAAPYRR